MWSEALLELERLRCCSTSSGNACGEGAEAAEATDAAAAVEAADELTN